MRLLLVVSAACQAKANADLAALDAVTFAMPALSVGLSPLGVAPPTHYWTSTVVSPGLYAGVQALLGSCVGAHLESWDYGAEPSRPDSLLGEMGLKRVIA